MAEAMFDALAGDKGLGYRAESAGVAALGDEPVAPNARTALGELGVYAEERRARQVSAEMLEEADLVLAMSPRHTAALRRLAGRLSSEIYTLPAFATGVPDQGGIPDPYGLTIAAHRSTLRQLYEYLERVVHRLPT